MHLARGAARRGLGGRCMASGDGTVKSKSALARTEDARTAAIIVIGDEILKGQTKDTNTHFLACGLRELGIHLERVSIIPDQVDTIAQEVSTLAERFDVVLTSGGIGPTHDDVTFEGVARAFGDTTAHHPTIVDLCKTWFKKEDLEDPCFKLALIPTQSKLNFGVDKVTGKETWYPLVSVRNVFLFPGVPDLLRKAFTNLGSGLLGAGLRRVTAEVYLAQEEVAVTAELNRLVAAHPAVQFGCYPCWLGQHYRTKVTMEAATREQVDRARDAIQHLDPVTFDPRPVEDAWDKLQGFLAREPNMRGPVEEALAVVEECFDRFQPDAVSVCYNGGKDCIALLHLVHTYRQHRLPAARLKSFYVREPRGFPEVENFLESSVAAYGLDNSVYQAPMKAALGAMLAAEPAVVATVLGVRGGDPGAAHLAAFSPTDGDWPRVERVHPLLGWSYAQVWRLLRGLSLPYPALYDRGYTSLGTMDNTVPNPALAYTDPMGEVRYRPAHMLEDQAMERRGRL